MCGLLLKYRVHLCIFLATASSQSAASATEAEVLKPPQGISNSGRAGNTPETLPPQSLYHP